MSTTTKSPKGNLITDDVWEHLGELQTTHNELSAKRDTIAADMETASQAELTRLNRRISELAAVVMAVQEFEAIAEEVGALDEMLSDCGEDADGEMAELVQSEYDELLPTLAEAELKVVNQLVPREAIDEGNAVLEIRAGTGGREAALFTLDLWKMYERACKKKRWKIESVNMVTNDDGGFRHVSATLQGRGVFGALQHETGVHRVQRIPETETQGRVHTSTSVVVVMPEPTKQDLPEINEKDIKVETFKASGAGGQHVNTTDSAVRMTHEPTGIIVECQSERSQLKNRNVALKILRARIFDMIREKEKQAALAERQRRTGNVTGDRSERIRTYNIPQDRVTDHRCNYDATAGSVLQKDALNSIIDALEPHFKLEKLQEVVAMASSDSK